MAYSVTAKCCLLALALVCISFSCCYLGKADDDHDHEYDDPQTGVGGVSGGYGGGGGGVGGGGGGRGIGGGGVGGGIVGGSGGGGVGGIGGGGGVGGIGGGGGVGGIGGGGGVGVGGGDPAEIVAKALLCFNDKYIYSSCEESYRLTESGDLHVPPEYADEYCSGPCLAETHLVLNCVENILKHFVFYNRATIRDIRDTIKAGCSYGPERGDFNVAEHIEAEENNADKGAYKILFTLGLMIIARVLLVGLLGLR